MIGQKETMGVDDNEDLESHETVQHIVDESGNHSESKSK